MLSTSKDESLLTLGGKEPHNPKDTNDKTLRFESLVRTVKKESMEKLFERVSREGMELTETDFGALEGELLFPMTVNSVM